MGLKKTLKGIGRAIPLIVTYAPAIADAVRQVKDALKKRPAGETAPDAPVAAAPAGPAE